MLCIAIVPLHCNLIVSFFVKNAGSRGNDQCVKAHTAYTLYVWALETRPLYSAVGITVTIIYVISQLQTQHRGAIHPLFTH